MKFKLWGQCKPLYNFWNFKFKPIYSPIEYLDFQIKWIPKDHKTFLHGYIHIKWALGIQMKVQIHYKTSLTTLQVYITNGLSKIQFKSIIDPKSHLSKSTTQLILSKSTSSFFFKSTAQMGFFSNKVFMAYQHWKIMFFFDYNVF